MSHDSWNIIEVGEKTNSSPLKMGRIPKGKDRLPTIHFSGPMLVSGSVLRGSGYLVTGYMQVYNPS